MQCSENGELDRYRAGGGGGRHDLRVPWPRSSRGDGGHQPLLPQQGTGPRHGGCGRGQDDSVPLPRQHQQQHEAWQHPQEYTARTTVRTGLELFLLFMIFINYRTVLINYIEL